MHFSGYETGLPHNKGAIYMGHINQPAFDLYVGANKDGMDIQLGAALAIDQARLTTNTAGDAFEIAGIRFAESFTGDETDPSTWAGQGNFIVGDIFAGAPATFDVGSTPLADGTQAASVALSLPMAGSLRMENLSLNGTDFGPVAIDGIRVHALEVFFVP